MSLFYQVFEDGTLFLVYFCLTKNDPQDDKVIYYQIPRGQT